MVRGSAPVFADAGLGTSDRHGDARPLVDLEIDHPVGEEEDAERLHIARSEVVSGYAQGTLAVYRQSATVKQKQGLTAGDGRVDPECELNAQQGAIPLDVPFASGHLAPIVHPNCRCVLQPVVD